MFASPVAPPDSRTCCAIAATCASFVTSHTIVVTPVSRARASSRSRRLATATTSQPCATNSRTLASPMPDEAPVTTTRFMLLSPSMQYLNRATLRCVAGVIVFTPDQVYARSIIHAIHTDFHETTFNKEQTQHEQ